MKRCNSCGGIVGVDCFNQAECAEITRDMAERREQEAMEEHGNYEYQEPAPTSPLDKLNRMMLGERVVMSDADLDLLAKFDASNLIRSIPNPQRCGVLDAYECWIERKDLTLMAERDGQITTGGLRKPTPPRSEYDKQFNPIPRFEVAWIGYAESPYKVIDMKTHYVVKEFDSAAIGERIARKAACELTCQLNGSPKMCPECDGEGRTQVGPSEQTCEHCAGRGYQIHL